MNNNYTFDNNRYQNQRSNGTNGRYNGGYNNQYQNQQSGYGNKPKKKRSGCSMKSSFVSQGETVNEPLITGWNKSRERGFISFVAAGLKDKKKRLTKNPNIEKWVAKIQFKRDMSEKLVTCFFDKVRRKLYFPDHMIVASPYAPNGGYFGKFSKRR